MSLNSVSSTCWGPGTLTSTKQEAETGKALVYDYGWTEELPNGQRWNLLQFMNTQLSLASVMWWNSQERLHWLHTDCLRILPCLFLLSTRVFLSFCFMLPHKHTHTLYIHAVLCSEFGPLLLNLDLTRALFIQNIEQVYHVTLEMQIYFELFTKLNMDGLNSYTTLTQGSESWFT